MSHGLNPHFRKFLVRLRRSKSTVYNERWHSVILSTHSSAQTKKKLTVRAFFLLKEVVCIPAKWGPSNKNLKIRKLNETKKIKLEEKRRKVIQSVIETVDSDWDAWISLKPYVLCETFSYFIVHSEPIFLAILVFIPRFNILKEKKKKKKTKKIFKWEYIPLIIHGSY